MPITLNLDEVVAALSADLTPVRPLPAPAWRTLAWFGSACAVAAAVAAFSDLGAFGRRLVASPDMWLAPAGSILTAVTAAYAAFLLSVPGRGARWALLPLPPLVLWIGASGMGCLRTWAVPGTETASLAETRQCLVSILMLSVPLMALMVLMIRRAFPLRPDLTTFVGGLAVAAASASLLDIFHPYDASMADLAVHLVGLATVVGINQLTTRHRSRSCDPISMT